MASEDAADKWYERRVAERKEKIVRGIRRLADDIERAEPNSTVNAGHRFSTMASNIVHEMTWGIANLHLDILVEACGSADELERAASTA